MAAEEAREQAVLQAQAQETELNSMQKRLKESEHANTRLSSDFGAQKEKMDGKIQNQRQVLRFLAVKEGICTARSNLIVTTLASEARDIYVLICHSLPSSEVG